MTHAYMPTLYGNMALVASNRIRNFGSRQVIYWGFIGIQWNERIELIRKNLSPVRGILITALMNYQSTSLRGFLLCKLTDFYMIIEFQQTRSPHVHSLRWIENVAK